MEIERKYLVKHLPENLESFDTKVIEQGYLCSNPVVRIRKSNCRYILTYKSRMGVENADSSTRVNQEVEVPLNESGYNHLKEKVDGYLISKVRYLIPLPDGHLGELDVFSGNLQGLYFIEVEFKDEEDAREFVPPEWFGDNVSEDHRYSNSYLSTCKEVPDFK